MKMIITKDDVKTLSGKFIVEIMDGQENLSIFGNDDNNYFAKEKRLMFVSGLTVSGFYYNHGTFDTVDEFVGWFNPRNGRFRRLLTSSELDKLNEILKRDNY